MPDRGKRPEFFVFGTQPGDLAPSHSTRAGSCRPRPKAWTMAEILVPARQTHVASIPYTEAQLDAIRHIDGNLQIIACAGSGKTQVISERVAEILERKRQEGIRPSNIVAFTFTDRAAAALKDRIARRIDARLGAIPGLAELYVGTIHGYC